VPLPFISYGGSALLSNLLAIGILLACARTEPAAQLALNRGKKDTRMTGVVSQ
jgi:cell division protein FtsW